MDVNVKKFDVAMEVKNSGIEFGVREPKGRRHLGDLVMTKAGLKWCKGKEHRTNGTSIKWTKFIEWAESQ